MKFDIPHLLTDLNTYIQAERGNKFQAANIKKENTGIAFMYARRLPPVKTKAKIIFTWYCANEKKDPDNISFAKKFILDGLVSAGVLENDGWKQIEGFEDRFEVDKANPHIEVEIQEIGA